MSFYTLFRNLPREGPGEAADVAWDRYCAGLKARSAVLHPEADQDFRAVLDETAEEIAVWRAHGDEYGYLLSMVRPA